MSITLDGNGNSVPSDKPRPRDLSEAEKILRLLFGCHGSCKGGNVELRVPMYLWDRMRIEATKPVE